MWAVRQLSFGPGWMNLTAARPIFASNPPPSPQKHLWPTFFLDCCPFLGQKFLWSFLIFIESRFSLTFNAPAYSILVWAAPFNLPRCFLVFSPTLYHTLLRNISYKKKRFLSGIARKGGWEGLARIFDLFSTMFALISRHKYHDVILLSFLTPKSSKVPKWSQLLLSACENGILF